MLSFRASICQDQNLSESMMGVLIILSLRKKLQLQASLALHNLGNVGTQTSISLQICSSLFLRIPSVRLLRRNYPQITHMKYIHTRSKLKLAKNPSKVTIMCDNNIYNLSHFRLIRSTFFAKACLTPTFSFIKSTHDFIPIILVALRR
jgi:hypothetical protein